MGVLVIHYSRDTKTRINAGAKCMAPGLAVMSSWLEESSSAKYIQRLLAVI